MSDTLIYGLRYFRLIGNTPTQTDILQDRVLNINVTLKEEIKQNTCEILLKDAFVNSYGDGAIRSRFTDSDGQLVFKAVKPSSGFTNFEERVEVYCARTTDGTLDVFQEDYRIFTGQIIEVEVSDSDTNSTIQLNLSDRTFNILNRIWSKTYEDLTCVEIIRQAIRDSTTVNSGVIQNAYNASGVLGTGIGYRYPVDARLFSEGLKGGSDAVTATSSKTITALTATFISDGVEKGDIVRNTVTFQVALVSEVISQTQLKLSKAIFNTAGNIQVSNGFICDFRPDGTAFPTLDRFGFANKPLYDWANTLVQKEYTNFAIERTELSQTVVQRPLKLYVDGRNRLHIYYPDNTPTHEFSVGATSAVGQDVITHHIQAYKLTKGVFDVVNYIIFVAGTDMNNKNIRGFAQDRSAGGPIVKDSLRTYPTIARLLKQIEANAGNIVQTGADEYDYPSAYPVTFAYSGVVCNNDAEYNAEFRRVCRSIGKARAEAEITQTGQPRWQGSLNILGENLRPSDLLKFTSRRKGIAGVLLRMNSVQHNVTPTGWFTTLNLKEDVPEER